MRSSFFPSFDAGRSAAFDLPSPRTSFVSASGSDSAFVSEPVFDYASEPESRSLSARSAVASSAVRLSRSFSEGEGRRGADGAAGVDEAEDVDVAGGEDVGSGEAEAGGEDVGSAEAGASAAAGAHETRSSSTVSAPSSCRSKECTPRSEEAFGQP